MDQTPLNFDLERVEVPVTVGGKDYVLLEIDGAGWAKYQSARDRTARVSSDTSRGVLQIRHGDGLPDTAFLLLHLCLFERAGPEAGAKLRPVPLDRIKGWPHRVIKPLFEKAREISGITDDAVKRTADEKRREVARLQRELAREEGGAEDPKGSPNGSTAG